MMKRRLSKKLTYVSNEDKIYGLYSVKDNNNSLCSVSRDKNILESIVEQNPLLFENWHEIKQIPVYSILKINSPTSNIFNYNIKVFGKDKNLIVVKSTCKKIRENVHCWNKTKIIDGVPVTEIVLLEMNANVYKEHFEELVNEKYFENGISPIPILFNIYDVAMFRF